MRAARKARDVRLLEEKYAKYGSFKEFAMRDDVQAALTQLEHAWLPETTRW